MRVWVCHMCLGLDSGLCLYMLFKLDGYNCKNDGVIDILFSPGGSDASWEHTHPGEGRIRGRSTWGGGIHTENLKGHL